MVQLKPSNENMVWGIKEVFLFFFELYEINKIPSWYAV